MQIDVSALNEGSAAGGPGANALAVFQEFNAAVNLTIGSGGINFQAVASSHRGGGAFAVASALIVQDDVAVHGGIAVKANAFNGAGGAGNAIGIAGVLLQANSGDVTVDGAIDVEALASDQGAGNASAGALTLMLAQAGVTGGITVGSLTDRAKAVDFGGGTARGLATVLLDGGNTGPSTISRSSAIWRSTPRPTTTPDSAATISAPPPVPLCPFPTRMISRSAA